MAGLLFGSIKFRQLHILTYLGTFKNNSKNSIKYLKMDVSEEQYDQFNELYNAGVVGMDL